ncbi:hypothetical protein N005_27480 [Pseudomonas mediterranea CFBP 5447]|nr:hypothetical protein N005_27480 [Pseudomonas mediterranea CFBP 5447]
MKFYVPSYVSPIYTTFIKLSLDFGGTQGWRALRWNEVVCGHTVEWTIWGVVPNTSYAETFAIAEVDVFKLLNYDFKIDKRWRINSCATFNIEEVTPEMGHPAFFAFGVKHSPFWNCHRNRKELLCDGVSIWV